MAIWLGQHLKFFLPCTEVIHFGSDLPRTVYSVNEQEYFSKLKEGRAAHRRKFSVRCNVVCQDGRSAHLTLNGLSSLCTVSTHAPRFRGVQSGLDDDPRSASSRNAGKLNRRRILLSCIGYLDPLFGNVPRHKRSNCHATHLRDYQDDLDQLCSHNCRSQALAFEVGS